MEGDAGADEFDPVLVEVLRNELEAIVEEMHITVRKTGRSPLVRIGDLAVTLADGEGRAIGVGSPSLLHVTFYVVLRAIIAEHGETIAPGDVFMVNDPYSGASHFPDLLVFTPVFWRDQRVAFSCCYSHQTDMGGRFPGSMTGFARESYEEGVRVPIVRYARAGKRNDDVVRLLLANVRAGDDFLGDLEAKVAGGWRAGQQLNSVLDKYGMDAFVRCCGHLNAESARLLREQVHAMPDCALRASVCLPDDGIDVVDPPLRVCVSLQRDGDRLVVDFAGTSAQAAGAINVPYGNVLGSVVLDVRNLLCPEAMVNDGFMSVIDVRLPESSVVNPRHPAAVGGRASTLPFIDEVMHRAIAQAFPERVPVPRELYDGVHFTHSGADGSSHAVLDLCSAGWGARPGDDGVDGAGSSYLVTLPAEFVERDYPLVIEGCGLIPDTAGPGRYRGSMAVYRSYRFLAPGHVMVRSNRVVSPDGMEGGLPGSPARTIHTRRRDRRRARATHVLAPGGRRRGPARAPGGRHRRARSGPGAPARGGPARRRRGTPQRARGAGAVRRRDRSGDARVRRGR